MSTPILTFQTTHRPGADGPCTVTSVRATGDMPTEALYDKALGAARTWVGRPCPKCRGLDQPAGALATQVVAESIHLAKVQAKLAGKDRIDE